MQEETGRQETELPLAGQLRAALSAFVAEAGTRRLLPTLLHVGTPGGQHTVIAHDPRYDAGLRADLVSRALEGLDGLAGQRPCPWLTRHGELVPADADLAWFAAAREAFDRHGLSLPGFFVVTRRGWLNVATDEAQRWHRIRPQRERLRQG